MLATEIEVRDLMRLYAMNMTSHSLAMMVNFDTVLTSPLDATFDALRNDPAKKAYYETTDANQVNTGAIIVKTGDYDEIMNLYVSTPYDQVTGWDNTGITGLGTEGILSYHFSLDATVHESMDMPSVVSFGSNPDCGLPWQCLYNGSWDSTTETECSGMNVAWYTFLDHFAELNWRRDNPINTTESAFHPSVFLGYCSTSGTEGYRSISHTTLPPISDPPVVAPPVSPAPNSPAPVSSAPVDPTPVPDPTNAPVYPAPVFSGNAPPVAPTTPAPQITLPPSPPTPQESNQPTTMPPHNVGVLAYTSLGCNVNATPSLDSNECLTAASSFADLVGNAMDNEVTIPCGSCYTVDVTDGSTLTVPGGLSVLGRLHFPSTSNLVLNTTSIFVQGMWSMDTPTLGNTVTISIFGNESKTLFPHDLCCDSSVDPFNPTCDPNCADKKGLGIKPFVVAGGQLDIRAIDTTCPSWTKLRDVQLHGSGNQSLVVDPNFARCVQPGDDLLVTSDSYSANGHSRFTASTIDTLTGHITILESTTHTFATEAGPGEPVFAAEVALLSRRVKFRAEEDPYDDLMGAHSIIFHTPYIPQTIQGVEFSNVGQAGILGRYPVHFHLCGWSPSLVSKNVIRNTNQRCVFIHNTDGVTIDDNVAFNTKGHCYSTETGVERFNTFSNNLAAGTWKLPRSNGQSDSPDHPASPGKHQASSFWIRNMENTFVNNVAAGSSSIGFWLEMKDKNSNQLNGGDPAAFRDNVAHSCYQGFLTYKKGWKPRIMAVLDGFKSYKNNEGFKFHISGNFKFTNAIVADNQFVRYGVWNGMSMEGVTWEESEFIGLSDDARLRLGTNCPRGGIRASYNNWPGQQGQFALTNVTFSNWPCGKSITWYTDSRYQPTNMGDPLVATNVQYINSVDSAKPSSYCKENFFMEDFDASIGPSGKAPGFILRDTNRMKAFLPPGVCETISYSTCGAYCENVCVRLVHIKPIVSSGGAFHSMTLTNENGVSYTYTLETGSYNYGVGMVVLPKAQYHVEFADVNGISVLAQSVEVEAFRPPRCSNYVTEDDFTWPTGAPTTSPSEMPSVSDAPSITPDPVIQLFHHSYQKWVKGTRGGTGVRTNESPIFETKITLEETACPSTPYEGANITTPCYILKFPGDYELYAKTDKTWTAGVGVARGTGSPNIWHFEDATCASDNPCVYLRNAQNGRSLYYNGNDYGASPAGDQSTRTTASYIWQYIDTRDGYCLENLALFKPATQSSNYQNKESLGAQKAVDGTSSITHTWCTSIPWWEVDLGGRYRLEGMWILNRVDCCGGRLREYTIQVLDSNRTEVYSKYIGSRAGGIEAHALYETVGQFVRLSLNRADCLHVREIEIIGEPREIAYGQENNITEASCRTQPI